MKSTLRIFTTSSVLLLSLMASFAWAISLDDAKKQGLVGEQIDGYLGTVTSTPTKAITDLITDINKKRQSAYTQGAKKAGVELPIFQTRMAQRLYERATKGQYVQSEDGKWYKK